MRMIWKGLLLSLCFFQLVNVSEAAAAHHGTTRPAASVQQTAREKPAANLLRIGLWKGQSQVVVSAAAPFVLRDAATKRGLAKFKANEPVQLFVKNHQLVLNKKGISAARLELVLQSAGSDMPVTINRRHYRGSLELSLLPGGIQVVNVVPLEAYVCSVLPSEMSAGWPAEALKAQAVAARTFALHERSKHKAENFDLCATTHCQVYEGTAKEAAAAKAAVDATRGQVLEYGGKPIYAAFHASSGGMTENSEDVWGTYLPYLRAVEDDDSESPSHHWQVKLTLPQLQLKLQRAGYDTGLLKRIDLTPLQLGHGPAADGSSSGRVQIIRFIGDRRTASLTGNELRQVLGLKSTLFDVQLVHPAVDFSLSTGKKTAAQQMPDVEEKNFALDKQHLVTGQSGETILIDGYGWGHGLGLSQWGAKAMADKGRGYKDILALYYSHAQLKNFD